MLNYIFTDCSKNNGACGEGTCSKNLVNGKELFECKYKDHSGITKNETIKCLFLFFSIYHHGFVKCCSIFTFTSMP